MSVFFGVTRFSVFLPSSKAWKLSRSSKEEEYMERLFSDERLNTRSDIFLNKALPIYQSMANRFSYKHIVQYSDELPEKWKEMLAEAKRRYPVLHLHKLNTRGNDNDTYKTSAYSEMLRMLTGHESSTVAFFRVDDDDMLSADYLDQLKDYAIAEFEGMAVSFGLGLFAIYNNGSLYNFRKIKQPLLGLGQAYIGRYDSSKHELIMPKIAGHARIDTVTPTILDSRNPTYVWIHHDNQDTRAGVTREDVLKKMKRKYNKLDELPSGKNFQELFPTINLDIESNFTLFDH